jgi:hypothetical protein
MDKIHAIRELAGRRVRLRPFQKAASGAGPLVEGIDDEWIVRSATDRFFKLENARTGHEVGLTYDHVWELKGEGIIVMRTQIILEGDHLTIEPVLPPE